MRAVVDTNILVRAMLKPGGSVGPVVDFLRAGRYVFLYSEATLNELIDVLGRPRMVHRYGITAAEVDALCALVIRRGEAVQPSRAITVCRDPKDNKFLELAVAGKADVNRNRRRGSGSTRSLRRDSHDPAGQFLYLLRQSLESDG